MSNFVENIWSTSEEKKDKKEKKYEIVDTLGGFDDEYEKKPSVDEIPAVEKIPSENELVEEISTEEPPVEEKIIVIEDPVEVKRVKNILEALLLVEKNGVKLRKVSHALTIPYSKLKKRMYELMEEYQDRNGGIIIKREKRGFVMMTDPRLSDYVNNFIDVKKISLSRVAYETLAVIALNQPITKAEIERIRGISSIDSMISKLRSKKLVRVVGRKETVGKPRIYGVGMMFFKHFGIKSLKELKDYAMQLLTVGKIPVDEEKIDLAVSSSSDILPENNMGEIGIAGPHDYDEENEILNENIEDKEYIDDNDDENEVIEDIIEKDEDFEEDEF